MTADNTKQYVDDFERLQDRLNSGWLAQQRRSALQQFTQNGFPSTRHENWKYTDVRGIARNTYSALPAEQVTIDEATLQSLRFGELDCIELVFINGVFSNELSNVDNLPKDIIVCDLATAIEQHGDLLAEHISRYVDDKVSAFTAMNTAFVQHGTFIFLPAKAVVERPINMLYLSGKQAKPFASHLRNLVVMEENTEATLIESYIGLDDSDYFTNTVTEVALNNGARLQHYKLQQESLSSHHIGNLNVQQQRDSYLESHSVSLGGGLVRNDIHSRLAAEGAEIVMNGLYMTHNKQHVDNHTRVDHLKPRTLSTENYRGVMNDRSRAVFNGKVVVHQDAQKIEAHQNNANLLLSDDAEIDTKPELEIYADDVKCSHGATVGQLDKDMLFYLQSRAVDKETAKSLLTFAFAEEVISKIKLQPIRNRLEYLVVGQLPDAELIREFTHE